MQNHQMEQKQENKRYEFYITYNPNIYWWTNSIDKPTHKKFNEIINASSWIKTTTPNFVNAFTAEFVVDKKDYYNYAKLVDLVDNKTTYWFFNSLQKTLRNAFLYELKMDVFTSYGYEFLKQALNKGLNVFINRTTAYEFLESSFVNNLQDEMLPGFNAIYPLKMKSKNYNNATQQINYDFANNGDDWTGIDANNRNGLIYQINVADANLIMDRFLPSGGVSMNWEMSIPMESNKEMNMFVDVYALGYNNLLLIPLNDVVSKFTGHYKDSNNANVDYILTTSTNTKNAKGIRDKVGWINKYKGCYCIPFFPQMFARCKGLVDIWQQQGNKRVKYTSGLLLPITSTYDLNLPAITDGVEIKNNQVSMFSNTTREINEYVLSKFPQFLNGKKWCSKFNDDLYGINHYEYNYLAGYTFYTYQDAGIDKDRTVYYSCGETLPIITDDYQKYLSSSLSSRNTNLEINNRNNAIGIAQSIFGGLVGIGAGAATAGIGGAIGGGVNAAFGIIGAVNQYKDYQKRYQAELDDRKRTSTPGITLSTNEKSNLANQMSKNIKFRQTPTSDKFYTSALWLLGYDEYDITTIQASNRIVWEYGFKVASKVKTDEIHYRKGIYLDEYYKGNFLYWDWKFDDEYFKNIFTTLDIELITAIKMCVNGEIRFWNINKPDYTSYIYTRHR